MPVVIVAVYVYVRVESILTLYVAMVAEEELGLKEMALARLFGRKRMKYIFGDIGTDDLKLADEGKLDSLLQHAVRKCLTKDSGVRVIYAVIIFQIVFLALPIWGLQYRFK